MSRFRVRAACVACFALVCAGQAPVSAGTSGVPELSRAAAELLELNGTNWERGLAAVAISDDLAVGPVHVLALRNGADPGVAAAAIAALPGPARRAVARVVDAFVQLEDATAATFSGISPADVERALRGEADAPAPPDLSVLLAARRALLRVAADLRLAPSGACDAVRVPPALAVDPAGCDSTYTDDYALVIDLGGTDVYANNAGGPSLDGGACTFPRASAAALFDLGTANDRYGDPAVPRSCGVNGGGFYGPGILVDEGGDDVYTAGGRGANGGNYPYGAGLLLDLGGSDRYLATSVGVNGGAKFGAGALIDLEGDDEYAATGGGGVNGAGEYVGGMGFLYDGAGNDRYTARATSGTFTDASNGGGGPQGRGFLVDRGGDDVYDGGSGASNGGGEAGVGFLLDAAGHDRYIAGSFGANGGAFNNGTGHLIDLEGNDSYTAGSIGTNGGGAQTGIGLLVDVTGDDSYVALAGGANGAGFTGLGLLLDLGGVDAYDDDDGGSGADVTVVPKGLVGGQIDTEAP